MATKPEFAGFMFRLAKAIPRYAPDLNDQSLMQVWFEEFGGLSTSELTSVFQVAVRRFSSFPSIAELLSTIGKMEQTDQDKAREVAERILGAISRYGQTSGNGESARVKTEAIAKHIGPIGMAVVKMQGGWNHVCEQVDNDNVATMKAQWRGLAESISRKGADMVDTPPDFARLRPDVAKAIEGLTDTLTPITGSRRTC